METSTQPTKKQHWLARRLPFFYGWIILPIATLSTVSTSPGQTLMVSVFNPSFRDSFHLNLSQLTGAYMLGTILAALPQSYIGNWADRLGIRKMLFLIITLFSLACVFISQANSLLMLFFSFFFLRLLGQGALELLSVNMLPMWFREKLGAISGFKNVSVNLLLALIPISVLGLINMLGWRTTYLIAGATVFLVMMPVIYFFYITRPEEIGQTIDGGAERANPESALGSEHKAGAPAPDSAFTLKEAMCTRAYWILTLSWFAWAAIATAITFNLLPIFTGKGLSEEQAAASFTVLMVASAFFQLFGGVIADRVKFNWIVCGALALYGIAVGALIAIPTGAVVLVYTLILGLAQGLFGGLGNTVWVRYFGRAHLGKIRGSVWTAAVAGSSIGPFLMGFSYDQSGDFQISLATIAVSLFALAILGLWATPPSAVENRSPPQVGSVINN